MAKAVDFCSVHSSSLNAAENFLRDRGVKPGMGLLDIYSTINAGRPGSYDRSFCFVGRAIGSGWQGPPNFRECGGSTSLLKGVNPSLTALTDCTVQRLDGHNWPAMLTEHACMGIAYVNGQVTALAVRAVLLSSLSLGGWASSSSSLMDARAEAPSPQQKYLPVEDLPPKREKPAMTKRSSRRN